MQLAAPEFIPGLLFFAPHPGPLRRRGSRRRQNSCVVLKFVHRFFKLKISKPLRFARPLTKGTYIAVRSLSQIISSFSFQRLISYIYSIYSHTDDLPFIRGVPAGGGVNILKLTQVEKPRNHQETPPLRSSPLKGDIYVIRSLSQLQNFCMVWF